MAEDVACNGSIAIEAGEVQGGLHEPCRAGGARDRGTPAAK